MATAVIEIDRPIFTHEDPQANWAPLPAHQHDIVTKQCVFCGEVPVFFTYEEYVHHFYANEWEGEPDHRPEDEEDFDWNALLCNTVGGEQITVA